MPRKKRLSADERRKQILQIATELFAEKGFAGTRTREIADIANISETLIFQHFKSKEDLYKAILLENLVHHPLQPEILNYESVNDDFAVFHTTAAHIFRNMNNPSLIRLFLYGILENPQLLIFSDKREQNIKHHLGNYIQKRIDDGAFVQTNAPLAAQSFIYSVSMFCLQQVLAGTTPGDSEEEFINNVVQIYINGLVK